MSTSSAPAGEDRPGSSPDGSSGTAAATGGDLAPFPADEHEYLVVADRLAERIRRGEFGDGRLPSRTAVMEHYGVGAGTVRHAWVELKRRGLTYVRQGYGTFTT